MMSDFLLINSYLALVVALVLEGQPALLLVGFLISIGVFNWWAAFILGVISMFIGDWIWWALGYSYGYPFVEKYGKYFFITNKKLRQLKRYAKRNNSEVIFGSKFVYGTGHIMLLLWGIAKQPFKNFWQLNLFGNVLAYLVFTSLGFYFGQSLQAWNWWVKLAGVVLFILIIWALRFIRKISFFKTITETE